MKFVTSSKTSIIKTMHRMDIRKRKYSQGDCWVTELSGICFADNVKMGVKPRLGLGLSMGLPLYGNSIIGTFIAAISCPT
jgi:hypothetical protein